MTAAPLKNVRVWLVGSVPEDEPNYDPKPLLEFVRRFTASVLREGGTLVHGSHPSFVPPLEEAARAVLTAGQNPTGLILGVSEKFTQTPEQKAEMERRREFAWVEEVAAADGNASENLLPMRDWLVQRADVVVAVGGKWWHTAKARAGLPVELDLAAKMGVPAFLVGAFRGAAGGMMEDPVFLRQLRNGLSEEQTSLLASGADSREMVNLIVEQMKRLPLLRTEADRRGKFRILALDGGGLRGVFGAAVLMEWAKQLGTNGQSLVRHFDLVVGTSTGSILALGLGMGLQPSQILEFYLEEGPKIFPEKGPLSGWFSAKYDSKILAASLEKAFKRNGQVPTLRESLCRLAIGTTEAEHGRAKVLTTPHTIGRSHHGDWTAVRAALASSSAPTYFAAAQGPEVAAVPYLDGGVWANNPSLLGLAEAVGPLAAQVDRIHLLNIGTLGGELDFAPRLAAGKFNWATGVADLFGEAQASGTIKLVQSILGENRYRRIDLATKKIDLSDVSEIEAMARRGTSIGEETYAQVWPQFFADGFAPRWRA
jgi:predicted acylesterase/phospholipase RssA